MKKKLFSLAVVVICLAIAGVGTYAFFTAEETAHNVITTDSIDIELNETYTVNVNNIIPGATETITIQVSNTVEQPAWVRIKLDKSIALAAGTTGTVDTGLIAVAYDNTNTAWTVQNGYAYYNKPLQKDGKTEPLKAAITFDKTMGNQYQNSTAKVNVCAQATQVANNGATVLDAQGWPEP